ncbi:peptidylprolyl isomerase [Blastococcus sp. CT_GayMR16]|uniref:peptidylprolyl isomerase n=1 Tax=Blastococcus sp. CT_GayMR16 TaxID=2559607 RepID=UPI0010746F46|nr:peptidylprolyl isomerase [Blastococcus sp. CT_GayMR16]TFV87621.1 peptidylprolyl isomerase [Blastococcus sp. CT_GayMR16]
MPTSKQRRQAAQRHLQKQLERRAELAKKRRRNLGILATGVAVVVVVVAALIITGVFSGDDDSTDAAGTSSTAATSSAAAATTNADGTVACTYLPDDSGNPNLTDVGTPPAPEATPTQGTATLLMSTDQGDLTLTLDRAKAPCATASFAYLASQKFFDGSPCHREVNQPTFGVLQCGDPTGSGSGGPSYKFAQEIPEGTTYPRGTIAMANTGEPNSTGSQFFLCFVDTQLSPDYTPVGTVDEAGLAVLDTVAAAGNDGSFEAQAGGGAPNLPVTINSIIPVG